MSTLITRAYQIGISATANQNFNLACPNVPDGTITFSRGNAGASSQTVFSVDGSNNITLGNRLTVPSGIKLSGPASLGAAENFILSYEYPVTRYYVGDGTGYSFAFSKRASSTTTDLVTVSDSGSITVGVNAVLPTNGYNISSPLFGGAIELRGNSATTNRGWRIGMRDSGTGFTPHLTYLDSNPILNANVPFATANLAGVGSSSGYANSSLTVQNNGGTGDSNDALMSFLCVSQYGINMHLRADGYFGIGGWSAADWRTYWNLGTGDFYTSGDVMAYSDPRLKTDIKRITNALSKVRTLDGVDFTWIKHERLGRSGEADVGILSTQVEKVLPTAVSRESIELDGVKYDSVAYSKLVPLLVEAIKDQAEIVDDQTRRLHRQSCQIDNLKSMVSLLISSVNDLTIAQKKGQS